VQCESTTDTKSEGCCCLCSRVSYIHIVVIVGMKWYRAWITAVEAPTIKTSQINMCRYYCILVDTGERVCVIHTNVRQLVKHLHYEPFQVRDTLLYTDYL
jgi:hypothetical protein